VIRGDDKKQGATNTLLKSCDIAGKGGRPQPSKKPFDTMSVKIVLRFWKIRIITVTVKFF
jgi:hypothetical protein